MKLEKLLCIGAIVFFIGCGSNKKVVKSSPRTTQRTAPVLVVKPIKKEVIEKPEVPKVATREAVVAKTAVAKKASDITQEYIDTYSAIAVKEMHTSKIPASITLSQGVLESGSGRSVLAMKSNNHFGIKCHKGWKGHSVSHDDDALGECFRKYKHPKTSYEDHSKFLTSRSRYASLFKLKSNDYVGWAHGLRKAGYATDKKYPNKLIAIIKKYNLTKYDLVLKEDVAEVKTDNNPIENQKVYYKVEKGDTLYSISRKYNKTVQELKSQNRLTGNSLSIGQELLID